MFNCERINKIIYRFHDVTRVLLTLQYLRRSYFLVRGRLQSVDIRYLSGCLQIACSCMSSAAPSVVGRMVPAETNNSAVRFCMTVNSLLNGYVNGISRWWNIWTVNTKAIILQQILSSWMRFFPGLTYSTSRMQSILHSLGDRSWKTCCTFFGGLLGEASESSL